jgi:hypothetical protein
MIYSIRACLDSIVEHSPFEKLTSGEALLAGRLWDTSLRGQGNE